MTDIFTEVEGQLRHRSWKERPSDDPQTKAQLTALIATRDMAGEVVMGMRVAAYRQPIPKPPEADQGNWDVMFPRGAGHNYASHWSTLQGDGIERLFTEQQVRDLLASVMKEQG